MTPVRSSSLVVAVAAALLAFALPAARAADVADTGLSLIPADAAFVSSTLRLREQLDAVLSSNAFAAVRKLPAIDKFFASLEEQKVQPGSPLSIIDTFLQLPENQEAVELLTDMVATDTFVYGDPSWIKLLELVKKVQQAQQAGNILALARGDASFGGGFEGFEGGPFDDDDDGDDNAALPGRVPVRPVRFQMVQSPVDLRADELTRRLIIQTIADNTDLLVIPDVVWGFATTKAAVATTQLKRVEVLLQLITQTNPDLAEAVQRKTIAGGEFVTFTFQPDFSLLRQSMDTGDDAEKLDAIFAALDELEVVVALGTIGNRVILSLGDSIDHLEKLVTSGGREKGLLGTKPLAPLLDHRDKPITAVSHVSEAMMKAVATSTDDIDQLADLSDDIARLAELPDGAAADARAGLETISRQYREWLPVPGPWTAFSFRSDQGFEGYAWDWSQNGQLDGSRRLDLLEHAGGAPLAALVYRGRTNVPRFDHVVSWVDTAWKFFVKHLLPQADDEVQQRVAAFNEHVAPLGRKFVEIVRRTFVPALANGQVGFVIDGKSKTARPHRDMPEAAGPLPLVEPAIVLALDDAGLFREGLNDLFALGDELVDAVREANPDAVPADYRIAAPEKTKVEGGTVWSWPLKKAGLDEQIAPAISLGKDTAVLSLVPKQAGRLVVASPLETGSQLTKFEEPLAAAATLDVAGLVEALEPWAVYVARFVAIQQREGSVDRDLVLDADTEDDQVKQILAQVKVVLEAVKSVRVATAETTTKPDAAVTHWRNVIRDLPR